MKPDRKIELDYLSSEELALALNVSRRTLHRWGRLRKGPPSIKVGRSVYYSRASVEQWLLSLEQSQSAANSTGGR